jgi:pyruvate/2-oxoglutarate dehydrogenase complex dihydrolipoamide dehydrogenase (E3) component
MEWTNGRKRVGGNTAEESMSQPERYDVLVLGSGFGGKLIAWHMAQSGRRTAVVERRWIGGYCPNIACLPSKNVIRSAEVAIFSSAPAFATLFSNEAG